MTKFDFQGLDNFDASDQVGIRVTIAKLFEGFSRREAAALNDVYSEDADWVNAFGSVKKGREEIVGYLVGLFADSAFNAGQVIRPPTNIARKLSDTIATVSSHLQIAGQRLVAGGVIPLRDNRSLRILQKQADGAWLIVSEMYMDVRQEQSYINHS